MPGAAAALRSIAFFAPITSSFQKLLAFSPTVSDARFAAPLVASHGLEPARGINIRATRARGVARERRAPRRPTREDASETDKGETRACAIVDPDERRRRREE